MTTEEDLIINGSGLFHWNSSLDKQLKLAIALWYKNLPTREQQFVHCLMEESITDECFFIGGDEL